ncbi:MAG: FixG Ig-like domain-containing protein [Burkholderiaceae bacterium]
MAVVGFATRPTWCLNAVRDRAVLARQVDNGAIENVYRLQMMNASERVRDVWVSVSGPMAFAHNPTHVRPAPAAAHTQTVTVHLDAAQAVALSGQIVPIHLSIAEADNPLSGRAETASTFMVPR